MGNPRAVQVKARSVVRDLGYSHGDVGREYKDWHIEVRSGLAYLSVWWSASMVFLSLSNTPVFYRPGPWEQYLDRLFHRATAAGRAHEPAGSTHLPERFGDPLEPSTDN